MRLCIFRKDAAVRMSCALRFDFVFPLCCYAEPWLPAGLRAHVLPVVGSQLGGRGMYPTASGTLSLAVSRQCPNYPQHCLNMHPPKESLSLKHQAHNRQPQQEASSSKNFSKVARRWPRFSWSAMRTKELQYFIALRLGSLWTPLL